MKKIKFTIYAVEPYFILDNQIKYGVLPYDLAGTISNYLNFYDSYKVKDLITFLKRCKLSSKSANKRATFLNTHPDLEW